MEYNINIEDYLTEDQIKQIIVTELRIKIKKDAERILNNCAFYVVFRAVDEALDGGAFNLIRDKAKDVIKNLGSFEVFRKKDAWGKEDSIAYKELQKAMEENKPLIHEKVKNAMEKFDYAGLVEYEGNGYISEAIIEAIARGFQQRPEGI